MGYADLKGNSAAVVGAHELHDRGRPEAFRPGGPGEQVLPWGTPTGVDFHIQPSPAAPAGVGRQTAPAIRMRLLAPRLALLLREVIPRSRQRAHVCPGA